MRGFFGAMPLTLKTRKVRTNAACLFASAAHHAEEYLHKAPAGRRTILVIKAAASRKTVSAARFLSHLACLGYLGPIFLFNAAPP